MTPAYLAARVEVRERRALSEYRTKRSIYKARIWFAPDNRQAALREALVARARWSYLHDLQREPESTPESREGYVGQWTGTIA